MGVLSTGLESLSAGRMAGRQVLLAASALSADLEVLLAVMAVVVKVEDLVVG
jgi:hypothetical protein